MTVTATLDTYGSGIFTARALLSAEPAGSINLAYKVIFDPKPLSPAVAMVYLRDSNTLPMPGETWPSNSQYVVARMTPTHVTTREQDFWHVDVTLEPDPLQLVPEVQWETSRFSETIYKDPLTDEPFKNTAGVIFAAGFEESKGRGRLVITKRFPETSAVVIGAPLIVFHKNAADVHFRHRNLNIGFAAGMLYCTELSTPWRQEPKPHFEVRAAFEIDPKGWMRHPLNVGYDCKNNAGLLDVAKRRGTPHGRPVPLDQNGKVLPEGQAPIVLNCNTIEDCDFNQYQLFPGQ